MVPVPFAVGDMCTFAVEWVTFTMIWFDKVAGCIDIHIRVFNGELTVTIFSVFQKTLKQESLK